MEHPDFDREILDCLYDGVYVLDLERRIIFWNKSAERITGYSSDEVMGRPCSDDILIHISQDGERLCEGKCPMMVCLEEGCMGEAEIFLHHKDGHRVPVVVRAMPLHDAAGQAIGAVEVFGDNSPRVAARQRIQELEKLAMLDELTRLPNRRYILEQLDSRLHELRRAGWPFGVIYLDIDHFKKCNDQFGHDVGDQVLKMVSRTMAHNSRPFDVMGRWGGEEFLGVVPNVNRENLKLVAERYRTLVAGSEVHRGEDRIKVTISGGATMATPEDTVETLLKRADDNLFASKKAGRDLCTVR
jgi:diguanylate cyclase (GGDEF)-like protein/PAS domain S-box-containing protein